MREARPRIWLVDRLFRDNAANIPIEYGMIAALIAIVAVSALRLGHLSSVIRDIAIQLPP